MGILKLKQELRSRGVLKPSKLSDFSGEYVAIDVMVYLHNFKSTSDDQWLYSFKNMIAALRNNNIFPIFVYDGVSPPEKEGERKRRKRQRKAYEQKTQQLKKELEDYIDSEVVSPGLEILYNKILPHIVTLEIDISDEEFSDDDTIVTHTMQKNHFVSIIEQEIKRRETRCNRLTPEDIAASKEFLDVLNLPYVLASGEGEFTCAKMCAQGLVSAVVTDDTDAIACGSPVVLCDLNYSKETVNKVSFSDVLLSMNMTSGEFLDFCIMCGTDFNTNIPGIGVKRSYELIRNFRSIENIEKYNPQLDTGTLNYKRVRRLFKYEEDDDVNFSEETIHYSAPHPQELCDFFRKHNIELGNKDTDPFVADLVFD